MYVIVFPLWGHTYSKVQQRKLKYGGLGLLWTPVFSDYRRARPSSVYQHGNFTVGGGGGVYPVSIINAMRGGRSMKNTHTKKRFL